MILENGVDGRYVQCMSPPAFSSLVISVSYVKTLCAGTMNRVTDNNKGLSTFYRLRSFLPSANIINVINLSLALFICFNATQASRINMLPDLGKGRRKQPRKEEYCLVMKLLIQLVKRNSDEKSTTVDSQATHECVWMHLAANFRSFLPTRD